MKFEGVATHIQEVDVSSSDFTNPNVGNNIIFCVTGGQVDIVSANGVACSINLVAGQYWKFSPATIKNTSTAVVQLHYLVG